MSQIKVVGILAGASAELITAAAIGGMNLAGILLYGGKEFATEVAKNGAQAIGILAKKLFSRQSSDYHQSIGEYARGREEEYLNLLGQERFSDQVNAEIANHYARLPELESGLIITDSEALVLQEPDLSKIAFHHEQILIDLLERYNLQVQHEIYSLAQQFEERFGSISSDIGGIVEWLNAHNVMISDLGEEVYEIRAQLAMERAQTYKEAMFRLDLSMDIARYVYKNYTLTNEQSKSLQTMLEKANQGLQIIDLNPSAALSISITNLVDIDKFRTDVEIYRQKWDTLLARLSTLIQQFSSQINESFLTYTVTDLKDERHEIRFNIDYFAEPQLQNLRISFNKLLLQTYGYADLSKVPDLDELVKRSPNEIIDWINSTENKSPTMPDMEGIKKMLSRLYQIGGRYKDGSFAGGEYQKAVETAIREQMYSQQRLNILNSSISTLGNLGYKNNKEPGFMGNDYRKSCYLEMIGQDGVTVKIEVYTENGAPKLKLEQEGNRTEPYYQKKAEEILKALRQDGIQSDYQVGGASVANKVTQNKIKKTDVQ